MRGLRGVVEFGAAMRCCDRRKVYRSAASRALRRTDECQGREHWGWTGNGPSRPCDPGRCTRGCALRVPGDFGLVNTRLARNHHPLECRDTLRALPRHRIAAAAPRIAGTTRPIPRGSVATRSASGISSTCGGCVATTPIGRAPRREFAVIALRGRRTKPKAGGPDRFPDPWRGGCDRVSGAREAVPDTQAGGIFRPVVC